VTAPASAGGIDLDGYGAAEAIGVTAIDPEDAVLATRLVERCCGPDAPSVLAILGLDAVPGPGPRREPGPRVAPDSFRRATKGKGRRHR
jgi:hypothetical protein